MRLYEDVRTSMPVRQEISRLATGGKRVVLALATLVLAGCGPRANRAEEVPSARPIADAIAGVVDSFFVAEALGRSGPGVAVTIVADGGVLLSRGGITGFSANLYHFPDDRVTIAIMANVKARDDGAAPVDPLARRITVAYFALASATQQAAEARGSGF